MIETAIIVFVKLAMISGGLLIFFTVIATLSYCSGLAVRALYKNLRKVYSMTVVHYWLDRLEEGGVRVFEKAEKEDEAYRAKFNTTN